MTPAQPSDHQTPALTRPDASLPAPSHTPPDIGPFGAERINIEDFELSHMSPERGGGLSILIAGEEAARRAAELLEGQGYGVDVAPAA